MILIGILRGIKRKYVTIELYNGKKHEPFLYLMTPTRLKYKIYSNENIKSWGKVTNLVNLSTVFLMLTVVIRFDVF